MAGSSAGSIFVDLLLKDANFSDGMKKAGRALSDFGDAAASGAKIAAGALAAAGAALGALTVHQAHVIDATVKVSRSLGIMNESFQALGLVSDEAGVEQEKLASLIVKSQKSIVDAAKGGDAASKAFKTLGLSASDLIKLAPDQQFAKIEEALAKIENPTLRSATALAVFGKAGIDAVKISEDFAAKLEEAAAFNDKFNISVSSIDARKVEEANDSFGRLGKAIGGLGNTIAVELSPFVTALSKELLDAGLDGQTMSDAISAGLSAAATVIDTIREGIIGLEAIFLKFKQSFLSIAEGFSQINLALAKSSDAIFSTSQTKEAERELQKVRDTAAGAAEAYAKLESEAGGFVTTSEKIAKVQAEAQKRAEEAEKKGLKTGGNGGDVGQIDEKRLSTLQSISSELEKQTEAVKIQNDFFGESQAIIDRQLEQQQIMQKLKESGIELSDAELQQLNDKLALLEGEKQLNIELQEAEKARKQAADELLKQQEAEQKLLDESVQKVREELVDGLLDAAKGAGNFGDRMKKAAASIAEAVVKAQLLKVITDATGGSSGGGGGLFGGGGGGFLSFLGGLASFDIGTDYVPYDMVANIHKGERILTPEENKAYASGAGVTMNVYTPNADSFRASDRQITRKLKSRMGTA